MYLEKTRQCEDFYWRKYVMGTPQQKKWARAVLTQFFGVPEDNKDWHSCQEIHAAIEEDRATFSPEYK